MPQYYELIFRNLGILRFPCILHRSRNSRLTERTSWHMVSENLRRPEKKRTRASGGNDASGFASVCSTQKSVAQQRRALDKNMDDCQAIVAPITSRRIPASQEARLVAVQVTVEITAVFQPDSRLETIWHTCTFEWSKERRHQASSGMRVGTWESVHMCMDQGEAEQGE
ncbi:uncharacterized protein LOC142589298 isoform X2 [Dermacentor variabilis]|uniref:uncharacterized protein LOC142589298 isoform X2 n=1 Tax=Dermacentor variabilis TaxID=34621 RepID=UPI003F5B9544